MVIRSFDDVQREIRILKDELDKFRSQNIDLNGRKVINAGKSSSDKDYITRKEVLDLLVTKPTVDRLEPGWCQIDFTVSAPTVGDDIAPRPVPFIPFNEKAVPVLCGARLRTPPSGGAFTLRWNHYSKLDDNTVDLFNGELLTIPDGGSYSTITTFYPNRNISTQDYFTLDIDSVNDGAGLYTFLAVMVR